MRYYFVAVLIFLGAKVVSGVFALPPSQLPNGPECSNICVETLDLTGCATTDNVCLCKSNIFIGDFKKCISTACSGNDQISALSLVQGICESVGVTLTTSSSSTVSGTVSTSHLSTPSHSIISSSSRATSSSASIFSISHSTKLTSTSATSLSASVSRTTSTPLTSLSTTTPILTSVTPTLSPSSGTTLSIPPLSSSSSSSTSVTGGITTAAANSAPETGINLLAKLFSLSVIFFAI